MPPSSIALITTVILSPSRSCNRASGFISASFPAKAILCAPTPCELALQNPQNAIASLCRSFLSTALSGPRDRPGAALQLDGRLAPPSPTQQTSASLDTLWLPGERLGGWDPGIHPGVGLAKLLMEDLVGFSRQEYWSGCHCLLQDTQQDSSKKQATWHSLARQDRPGYARGGAVALLNASCGSERWRALECE